jgi:methylase of polypeptide subunit release factors
MFQISGHVTDANNRMLEASPSIRTVLQRGMSANSTEEESPKILDLCCGQGTLIILYYD